MRALYLLRHGVTEANEKRLYGGSTDSPLSENGRRMAREIAVSRPLPVCDIYLVAHVNVAEAVEGTDTTT